MNKILCLHYVLCSIGTGYQEGSVLCSRKLSDVLAAVLVLASIKDELKCISIFNLLLIVQKHRFLCLLVLRTDLDNELFVLGLCV